MSKLLELLKQVESDFQDFGVGKYLSDGAQDKLPRLIQDVIAEACVELIDADGTPNFKAMRLLEAEGFRVYKGEYDSFGWLTGVISTSKGMIAYG